MSPAVSVVIPTYNERSCLERAIHSLGARDEMEVIVVDGGSTDGTLAVTRSLVDHVVQAPRGRANQLNAGAAVATGEVLLFLHADAVLGDGWVKAVREALQVPGTVGGAFAIQVDSQRPSLKLISWAVNLRSRLLRLPYGDQALFVRRDAFKDLGGYRSIDIMEDVDLVRRLRTRGRLTLVGPPLRISDRRWRANGVMRTTLVNLGAITMFTFAVEPRRIRAFYDSFLVSQ